MDQKYDGVRPTANNWEWYEPPENSAPVSFFKYTTLHGLQYLGQRKRHVCERIFWFIAFTAAVVTAAILIWKMWQEYVSTPIITVISSTEKSIDHIPFPAVTVCNVNSVKKSKWEEDKRNAEIALDSGLPNKTVLERLASVFEIFHICQSSKTFAESLWNKNITPPNQEKIRKGIRERYRELKPLSNPSRGLYRVAQSCDEMIIFCRWRGTITNCSLIFEEIITDFGLCCTFNTVPVSLLKRFANNSDEDAELVKEWKKADLNSDNLMFEGRHRKRKYPRRQLYAGRFAGLSFLVDPKLEEYHCMNTDSQGFVIGVNVPLDFPRMIDNGVAVPTSKEVFIGVRPEITITRDSAKRFELEKRHCYLEGEKKLAHYAKYTPSNCIDECIANVTLRNCTCLRYYMPRTNERLCSRRNYNCTEKIREKIVFGGVRKMCKECWPSCSEIQYHTEVTSLDLHHKYINILFNMNPHLEKSKNLSIVHVYFNVDSVFPRLRKEMTPIISLISNTGGLLGLCMGFSMLSVLEVLYHFTIRVVCNHYRKRSGLDGSEDNKEHDQINNKECGILQVSAVEKRDVGFLSKMLQRHHQISSVDNFADHHHHHQGYSFHSSGF